MSSSMKPTDWRWCHVGEPPELSGCLCLSCLYLSGPGRANPAEIHRTFFVGHGWKYMLHSPRSQNDKARNDFQWVFLGKGSCTQRRKMTDPRPPSQLVAELGLECKLVVLRSYCTSLLTQLPKKAAAKTRDSDFVAFSVLMHVTCLDFPSHIQNKVGRRLTR